MTAQQDHRLPQDCSLLFSAAQVQQAVDDIATSLNLAFSGERAIVLCVMNGALIFCGQLLTKLNFECVIDYCHATRYENGTRGRQLQWLAEPRQDLADENVLIIDDILDEGNTLKAIIALCEQRGAKSVTTAVLLDKQHDCRIDGITADHAALRIDDRYVFGFGMDYAGRYRNLSAIYALDIT